MTATELDAKTATDLLAADQWAHVRAATDAHYGKTYDAFLTLNSYAYVNSHGDAYEATCTAIGRRPECTISCVGEPRTPSRMAIVRTVAADLEINLAIAIAAETAADALIAEYRALTRKYDRERFDRRYPGTADESARRDATAVAA